MLWEGRVKIRLPRFVPPWCVRCPEPAVWHLGDLGKMPLSGLLGARGQVRSVLGFLPFSTGSVTEREKPQRCCF